ncbi:plcA, partial [Symbiodinium necroappetens]
MTSLESWMQQLPAEAKSRSICELALPGAHNAGASEVKCISPLVSSGGYLASVAKNSVANALAKPLAGVMAVCQADGIGQLLRKGVRLLDLRLGLHDEQLYICHTVVCNRTFCSVLEEVAEFLREQPEEVVVLLVKRDWGARDYFDTQ